MGLAAKLTHSSLWSLRTSLNSQPRVTPPGTGRAGGCSRTSSWKDGWTIRQKLMASSSVRL
jgi:hypothetical protein